MKRLIIFTAVIIGVTSCTTEFKEDKDAFTKEINTLGDSELLRDVKFEQFEPSNSVTASQLTELFNQQYEEEKQSFIASEERRISESERNIASLKDNIKRYKSMGANTFASIIKSDELKISNEEKNIIRYKQDIADAENGSYETLEMEGYKEMASRANEFIIKNDEVAYSYKVTYVVDGLAGKVRNSTYFVRTVYGNLTQKEDFEESALAPYFYLKF